MDRGVRAARLSASEETTLLRVDYRIAKTVDLIVGDVAQLIRVSMIERLDDKLRMTDLGEKRLLAIRGTAQPLAIAQLVDKIKEAAGLTGLAKPSELVARF